MACLCTVLIRLRLPYTIPSSCLHSRSLLPPRHAPPPPPPSRMLIAHCRGNWYWFRRFVRAQRACTVPVPQSHPPSPGKNSTPPSVPYNLAPLSMHFIRPSVPPNHSAPSMHRTRTSIPSRLPSPSMHRTLSPFHPILPSLSSEHALYPSLNPVPFPSSNHALCDHCVLSVLFSLLQLSYSSSFTSPIASFLYMISSLPATWFPPSPLYVISTFIPALTTALPRHDMTSPSPDRLSHIHTPS